MTGIKLRARCGSQIATPDVSQKTSRELARASTGSTSRRGKRSESRVAAQQVEELSALRRASDTTPEIADRRSPAGRAQPGSAPTRRPRVGTSPIRRRADACARSSETGGGACRCRSRSARSLQARWRNCGRGHPLAEALRRERTSRRGVVGRGLRLESGSSKRSAGCRGRRKKALENARSGSSPDEEAKRVDDTVIERMTRSASTASVARPRLAKRGRVMAECKLEDAFDERSSSGSKSTSPRRRAGRRAMPGQRLTALGADPSALRKAADEGPTHPRRLYGRLTESSAVIDEAPPSSPLDRRQRASARDDPFERRARQQRLPEALAGREAVAALSSRPSPWRAGCRNRDKGDGARRDVEQAGTRQRDLRGSRALEARGPSGNAQWASSACARELTGRSACWSRLGHVLAKLAGQQPKRSGLGDASAAEQRGDREALRPCGTGHRDLEAPPRGGRAGRETALQLRDQLAAVNELAGISSARG